MDFTNLVNLPVTINEVYDPDVYSTDVNKINKPMEDIPFGHILNVNWENLAKGFAVLQAYVPQAVYQDEVDVNNTGAKIVKRGSNGGIQVGDIYTTRPVESNVMNANCGLAFRGSDGLIRFENNLTAIKQSLSGSLGAGGLVGVWSGSAFTITPTTTSGLKHNVITWNTPQTVTLNTTAQNYKILIFYGGILRTAPYLLFPNLPHGLMEDRGDGCVGHAVITWDGAYTVTVQYGVQLATWDLPLYVSGFFGVDL